MSYKTKRIQKGWPQAILAAGALGIAGLANAANFVIDFEGLSHGQIVDDEYAGVSIGAQNFVNGNNRAVAFDTNPQRSGTFQDLVAPFDGPSQLSPGNILVIQRGHWCNATECFAPDDEGRTNGGSTGAFHFEFDAPVFINTIDFFDIDPGEEGGMVQFFGAGGAELFGSTSVIPLTTNLVGDHIRSWDRAQFDIGGVLKILVTMNGSGGIDNISGNTMVIPVPAVAFLFPSGLLAGLVWIRRRSVDAVPA